MVDKSTVHYIDVDTTEAQVALAQLETHGKMTAASIRSIVHKSYASMRIMAEMVSIVVPQWVDMMVGASLMMVNTFENLGMALTAAGAINPVFLLQATVAFVVSAMLFGQSLALMIGAAELSGQTQLMMSLLNTWSY